MAGDTSSGQRVEIRSSGQSRLDSVSRDPKDYPCTTVLTVRFRDLDAMGHVNNAVFLTYLEMGRVAYIRRLMEVVGRRTEAGNWPDIFPFVIAEISCRYLAPVTLEDRVLVRVRAVDIRRKGFAFEYLVETQRPDIQRVAAVAYSVQVAYDYASKRAMELPDWVSRGIEIVERRGCDSK